MQADDARFVTKLKKAPRARLSCHGSTVPANGVLRLVGGVQHSQACKSGLQEIQKGYWEKSP